MPKTDPRSPGSDYPATHLMENAVGEFAQGLRRVREGKLTPLSHQVIFLKKLDAALQGQGLPGRTMDCRRGCSYCCHYHVYITAEEALGLAEFVNTVCTPDQRTSFLSLLKRNVELVGSMSLQQHISTNVACAFLAEDGACGAYEVRPLACRKHHSYNVSACIETFKNPSAGDMNEMSADWQLVAEGFLAVSALVSREAGVDFARYEMSSAVLEGIENRSCLRRWKDGKTAFPTVRDRDSTGGLEG